MRKLLIVSIFLFMLLPFVLTHNARAQAMPVQEDTAAGQTIDPKPAPAIFYDTTAQRGVHKFDSAVPTYKQADTLGQNKNLYIILIVLSFIAISAIFLFAAKNDD